MSPRLVPSGPNQLVVVHGIWRLGLECPFSALGYRPRGNLPTPRKSLPPPSSTLHLPQAHPLLILATVGAGLEQMCKAQGGTEEAEGPLGRTVYYDTTAVIIVFYAFPYEITHSDSGEEFK